MAKATVGRQLEGYDTPDAAWAYINEQRAPIGQDDSRKRRYEELYDDQKVSKVPYLGTKEPGPRPGRAINLVGFPDLEDLAASWYDLRPGEQILVVGPKGDGKTCRLRALASLLCSAAPVGNVVVCIWNMERARHNLVSWFVDALKFAYSEKADVIGRIDNMGDEASLKLFLDERKALNEKFTFVVDGVQALDTLTSAQKMKIAADARRAAYNALMDIIAGDKVIFGISPEEAMHYREFVTTADQLIKCFPTEGFTEDQKETFMRSASVLGAVVGNDENRRQQLEFYAANHPHSLDILDQAAVKVASMKLRESQSRKGKMNVDPETGRWASREPDEFADNLTPEKVAELLESDEDWDLVITAFVEDPHFLALRKSLRGLEIEGDFSTDKQIMDADQRYAYKDDKFCSPFLQQIYVEEFRHKELESDECGPWVSYAKLVVRSPALNWCEAGWLCERLCNDVISRRGLCIDPRGFFLNRLSTNTFAAIPRSVLTGRLSKGAGVMYIPIQYNYGRMDALVFFRDTAGKLHIIGLQYTTSLEKHLHSESEFMSLRVLEKWYKNDILEATRRGHVELDYVFVCTTKKLPEPQKEQVRLLRDGSHIGILKHTRHVISFEDALTGRVNINVRSVIRDMAAARERCFVDVPGVAAPVLPPLQGSTIEMSKARFKRLRRYEADALAVNADIKPTSYKLLGDLKQKLLDDKVVVLVDEQ